MRIRKSDLISKLDTLKILLFLVCDPRKYFIFLYIEDFTHVPKIQEWGAGKFSVQPRRDSTKIKNKIKKKI